MMPLIELAISLRNERDLLDEIEMSQENMFLSHVDSHKYIILLKMYHISAYSVLGNVKYKLPIYQ